MTDNITLEEAREVADVMVWSHRLPSAHQWVEGLAQQAAQSINQNIII